MAQWAKLERMASFGVVMMWCRATYVTQNMCSSCEQVGSHVYGCEHELVDSRCMDVDKHLSRPDGMG
eukprot:1344389-Amphidinium_carterae.1